MKKLLLLIVVFCLVLCVFTACDPDRGGVSDDPDGEVSPSPDVTASPKVTPSPNVSQSPAPSNPVTP